MADFTNTWIGRRHSEVGSDHILGNRQAVRASVGFEAIPFPPYVEEVDGSTMCMTDLIEWPFEEDELGFSYPSGYLGARTRTIRRPMADGGGDSDEWWTCIPRVCGGAYTPFGRCGTLIPGLYNDFLGDCFNTAPTWNLRTPSGLLLPNTDEGNARSRWAPRNRGQKAYSGSIGAWGYIYLTQEDLDDGNPSFVAAALATDHVGFRNSSFTVTISATSMGTDYPVSGACECEIVALPITETWATPQEDGDIPSEVQSFGFDYSFASAGDPPLVIDIDVGDILAPGNGIPANYWLRYPYDPNTSDPDWVPPPIFGTSHAYKLAPRVDIPLWYFASTGNRCHKGGVIVPV